MSDIGMEPAAQPDPQGPGDGAEVPQNTGSPWDLSETPEELRPFVERELKRIEGSLTPKLQEAAELRKQFGSLADIEGLADVPVEELQALIGFRETLADEQAFEDWWAEVGEKMGFLDPDEGGEEAGEGYDEGDEPPPWAQSLIERLEQLEGGVRETQTSVAQERQQTKIANDLKALEDKHGEFDVDAVVGLAVQFADDPDAIAKGFAEYQRIAGAAQGKLVSDKENVPGGRPLSGGSADTSTEPVKGFAAADAIARQRIAGARG